MKPFTRSERSFERNPAVAVTIEQEDSPILSELYPVWRTQWTKTASKAADAEQAKGKVKEVAGKITGDSKLEGAGKADQV